MGRLDGKVVLITGTGRGMGRASALLFAREGAIVAGCDLDAVGADETRRSRPRRRRTMSSAAPVDLGDLATRLVRGSTPQRRSTAGSTSCSTTRPRRASARSPS